MLEGLLCFGMRRVLLVVLAVAVVLLGYRLYVRVSMWRACAGRLQDPVVQARLAPVVRVGEPGYPVILLLHGFGGSPFDLRPLLEQIPDLYPVVVPSLPGHGGETPEALSQVTAVDWRQFVLSEARQLAEERDIILCGFSLGGLLALDVADEIPVQAVIAINPYVGTPYKPWYVLPPSVWVRAGKYVVPYVKKVKSGQITDAAGAARYEPGYWHLALRAVAELRAYVRQVRSRATALSVPAFVHISQQDIVSDPKGMADLAAQCGIPEQRIMVWPNSNHVLLYDRDAEDVIECVLAQIRLHTRGRAD